jgi:hypothetical protein
MNTHSQEVDKLHIIDIPQKDAAGEFKKDKRYANIYIDLLTKYWYALKENDLHIPSFYSIELEDDVDFVRFATREDKLFFLICEIKALPKGKLLVPIAHLFLNNINGTSAQLHFGIIERCHALKRSTQIAEAIFTHISQCTTNFGGVTRPLVETFIGMTPLSNRGAVLYVKRLGFKELAVIPNAAEMVYDGTLDSLVVTTLNLQEGVKDGKWKVRRRKRRP